VTWFRKPFSVAPKLSWKSCFPTSNYPFIRRG
jgi:hypothetical protein